MKRFIILLAIFSLFATGCTTFSGPYYLNNQKYKEGIKAFNEKLQENPGDAESAYYVGRYYMALKKPKEAQPYISKSLSIAPDNVDYIFWSGVNYWALKQYSKERAAYRRVLELDPNHISANLYLAHSYLEEGKLAEAAVLYDKVIKLDEYNPEALYNRADILGRQGKKEEAVKAWKKYLEYYPDGSLAMSGTEKLNLLGDFTYRNFIFGTRNLTLRSITFKPGQSDSDFDSKSSLHVIAAMMEENTDLRFHIVAYVAGNAELAKARAKGVRDYILSGHPDFAPSRMPLSWFGSAEEVERSGKTFKLDESIQFITVIN
ncbi:tetratricopeptide repeat protein [Maridesulfovibrio salexigens]|uniref:Tetratricopeptide TPR_2 repeat protein n=1 Tax=Maridesulfovibrio salexigens (strain ATCC 14822 / DSM 2638 / NCIMB 8403 / VKM B-1763) TaxID=526222 RepID=C6C1P9_MARSD|nr:tetratricopeptide repeat protein [Maridesulfovibrio salexigens]ACS79295.1 Tetratricopeptide TPR_2 repeat protein [Maridesulfovibrio salexigens DSM 2638]